MFEIWGLMNNMSYFKGPTSFAPAIRAAIDVVKASGNQYHILVIIADGQVLTNCLAFVYCPDIRFLFFHIFIILYNIRPSDQR